MLYYHKVENTYTIVNGLGVCRIGNPLTAWFLPNDQDFWLYWRDYLSQNSGMERSSLQGGEILFLYSLLPTVWCWHTRGIFCFIFQENCHGKEEGTKHTMHNDTTLLQSAHHWGVEEDEPWGVVHAVRRWAWGVEEDEPWSLSWEASYSCKIFVQFRNISCTCLWKRIRSRMWINLWKSMYPRPFLWLGYRQWRYVFWGRWERWGLIIVLVVFFLQTLPDLYCTLCHILVVRILTIYVICALTAGYVPQLTSDLWCVNHMYIYNYYWNS